MAAGDTGRLAHFVPVLETIFEFLEATVQIEGYTNTRIIKMIIALLGDIATSFPQTDGVKGKATMPYVEQGIMVLQQQPNQEYKQQADWTLAAIKKL